MNIERQMEKMNIEHRTSNIERRMKNKSVLSMAHSML